MILLDAFGWMNYKDSRATRENIKDIYINYIYIYIFISILLISVTKSLYGVARGKKALRIFVFNPDLNYRTT